jgi:hypothetical protein
MICQPAAGRFARLSRYGLLLCATLLVAACGTLGFKSGLLGANNQMAGASGKYDDRPTITYTPKSGQAYLRSLMEPIEPPAPYWRLC